MKRILFVLAILLSISLNAKEKEPFQGKITYHTEFTGDESGMMSLIMFTKYEYHFGAHSIRLHLEGGMAFLMGDIIINHETNLSYMLDDNEKIAYDMTESSEEAEEAYVSDPIIIKTNEKEKILGYKCLKYEVTTIDEEGKSTMTEYWVTTKINPQANQNMNFANILSIDGVEGFPLKIVTAVEGIKMIQLATEIIDEKPEESLFSVPDGYQVKDISESPLMKMGEEEEE